MNSRLRSIVVLAVAGLAACTTNRYVVKMTPAADGVHREVTGWRERAEGGRTVETSLPFETRQRLARAYQAPVPEAAEPRVRFAATFPHALPSDLGGSGWLVRVDTPLGTFYDYREHVGGSYDRDAMVDHRRQYADRIVDLVIAWMRAELGTHPQFESVRAALDTTGRKCLRNALHLVGESRPTRSPADDSLDSLMSYAVEQGLIEPEDVVIGRTERPGLTRLAVRRLVRRALGIPDDAPSPDALAFLDEERIEGSWKAFAAKSPEVAAARTLLETAWPRDPTRDERERPDVLVELVLRGAFVGDPFDASELASLTLTTGVEPFETDGKWRSPGVEWADVELPPKGLPPAAHFARWSVPAAAYQTERFGRVALVGKQLADYARWRARLPSPRRLTWDAAVNALHPGEALRPAIERLTIDGPDGEERAKEGREILLGATK